MDATQYPPPVDRLLTYGRAHLGPWPDYGALGLGPEHVPDLVRMAADAALNTAPSDSAEVWAPIHAWRALGQLGAVEAVEPLLGLLHQEDADDNDWLAEEIPEVMGMIGPAAIPAVAGLLADDRHGQHARTTASQALKEIPERHPEARAECVAALTAQLAHCSQQDADLNAFLISALLDLRAVESAPEMERAFAADRVELTVAGDWEDVQIELGLLDQRRTPQRNYVREWLSELPLPPAETAALEEPAPPQPATPAAPAPPQPPAAKRSGSARNAKAKRKEAKKARLRNRKR